MPKVRGRIRRHAFVVSLGNIVRMHITYCTGTCRTCVYSLQCDEKKAQVN